MSDRERVARSWLIDIVEDEPEGAYTGRSSYDHEGASAALAELDRLRFRVAELEAAGDAVLKLHKSVDGPLDPNDNPIAVCDHCIDGWEGQWEYPCPTVRAVRGTIASGDRGEGSE